MFACIVYYSQTKSWQLHSSRHNVYALQHRLENNVSAPFTNFDFLQVASNPAVNYLHTGKALDVLSEFLRKDDESRWPNNVVLRQLGLHLAGSSELTRLIRGYLGSQKRMKFAELQ